MNQENLPKLNLPKQIKSMIKSQIDVNPTWKLKDLRLAWEDELACQTDQKDSIYRIGLDAVKNFSDDTSLDEVFENLRVS